jgi:ubiquinone/menaquinone biosynthesis C-methylase UbiE
MPTTKLAFLQQFLKFFYNLLYHQFAWTYDLVAWLVSIGQWNDWVASTIPFLAGEQILELGHGPGHLQELAWKNDFNPIGLDISPQMGRICQRKIVRIGTQPKLVNGSGTALPFKSETFPTVVATFPTEYIIHPSTLNEIYRVLIPGGKFILLPLAWITGSNPVYRLAAWLFKVTGQSTDQDGPSLDLGESKIRNIGFSVETHIIRLKHSKVLILEAQK